jgi:hypothetical protein
MAIASKPKNGKMSAMQQVKQSQARGVLKNCTHHPVVRAFVLLRFVGS